jgi:hypothetical protein
MKLILLLCLAWSCTTTQVRKPGTNYKLDLKLQYNGKAYDGIALLPKRDQYEIEISSRGKLDILDIQTCHRHTPIEGAFKKKKWLGKNYKSYVYTYRPTEMEKEPCQLEIGAYSAAGKHGWGLIEFKRGNVLFSKVQCNGETKNEVGSSVCQTKKGLIQTLKFEEPVIASPDCPVVKITSQHYEYAAPNGMCLYVFMNKAGEIHRHLVYGYEQVLIRNFE